MDEKGVIILIDKEWTSDSENDWDFILNTFSEIFKQTAKIAVVIAANDAGLLNFEELALQLKSVLCNQYGTIAHKLVNISKKCFSLAESCYDCKIILDEVLPDMKDLYLIHGRVNHGMDFIKELFQQVFHAPVYNVHHYCPNGSMMSAVASGEILKDKVSRSLMNFAKSLPAFDKKDISCLVSSVIPSALFSHGFSTRFGGISTNKFLSSLNLSFKPNRKDSKFCVEENKRRFANACGFDPRNIKFPKCAHKAGVWVIGKELEPASYDAMVTNQMDVTLMAPGADCAPLLFCDPVQMVCGAAHSGRKGIMAEVGKAVIKTMISQFQSNVRDILVTIGPTIGPCCYEVGQDLSKPFSERYGDDVVIQSQLPEGKPHLDLRLAIRVQLEESGVLPDNIDDGTRNQDLQCSNKVTFCTSCDSEKRFFSYRRDKVAFGNQVGFINIKNKYI